MTFNELKLCMAIHEASLGGGDRPRQSQMDEAAGWIFREYLRLFRESFFPYTADDIREWILNIRKNTDTKVKLSVAIAHGCQCFWVNRGKGPCSDEVECGHLVPRCRGGLLTVENCVIECRAHNNARREMTIEEYLR